MATIRPFVQRTAFGSPVVPDVNNSRNNVAGLRSGTTHRDVGLTGDGIGVFR